MRLRCILITALTCVALLCAAASPALATRTVTHYFDLDAASHAVFDAAGLALLLLR